MNHIILQLKYAITIGAALISYFLLLSLFNLHTKPILRVFNGIIVGFGIFEVIRVYKLEQGSKFSYAKGFSTGLITGSVATFMFTLFFLIFATEIDTNFSAKLVDFMSGNRSVHVGLVTVVVAIMGLATTLVITLTCMQYFKNSLNVPVKSE
jgi:hypothetical protein